MAHGIYSWNVDTILKGIIMPVAPHLSRSISEKLRQINPHFYARWNGLYEKWDIWFNDTIKMPYIVLRTSSIDDSTYKQLRYAMWVSNHLKYHFKRGFEQSKEIREKKLRDEENRFYELGKEAAPLFRTLADAGNSSHGRSVTMFPGFGTGK